MCILCMRIPAMLHDKFRLRMAMLCEVFVIYNPTGIFNYETGYRYTDLILILINYK